MDRLRGNSGQFAAKNGVSPKNNSQGWGALCRVLSVLVSVRRGLEVKDGCWN